MKNKLIEYVKSTLVLKITGKRPENFIRKLIQNQIELLKIEQKNRNEIWIKIYKEDYEKILEYKTIYDIHTIEVHGILRIKKQVKTHKIFLCFILLGIILLYGMSLIISEVEIVHTNRAIRSLLSDELKQYGIEKNHFRKSYQQIQKIKEKIVFEHKDQIEWLEIENIGTKYVVRVEPRKLKKETEPLENRDLVAKKAAVIKKIETKNGEVVKKINDYVEKGETIISGNITLNEEKKDQVAALGTVYGEVWYKVRVDYPLTYYEEKTTGRKNTVYTISFLHKRFELFNKSPYKNKKIEKQTILKNQVLPISFQKENQTEITKIEQILLEDEAVIKAEEVARKKIEKGLDKKEYIIDAKKLKVTSKDSKIVLDMFFSVYEDITDYKKIDPIEETPIEKEE